MSGEKFEKVIFESLDIIRDVPLPPTHEIWMDLYRSSEKACEGVSIDDMQRVVKKSVPVIKKMPEERQKVALRTVLKQPMNKLFLNMGSWIESTEKLQVWLNNMYKDRK